MKPARSCLGTPVLGAAVVLLCTLAASAVESGSAAPPFSLPALEGDSAISLADYPNQVIYLDFWAAWCTPCRKSLPFLDELAGEYGDMGFVVIGVNIDERSDDGRQFLRSFPVSYPIASDADGEILEAYGVRTLPTSFLIDRDGTVRLVHNGFKARDVEPIRNHVRALVTAAP